MDAVHEKLVKCCGYCLCTVHEQQPLVRGKTREKKKKGENAEIERSKRNALSKRALKVLRLRFLIFFFFSFQPQWLTRSFVNGVLVHYSQISQTSLFINFFIKNGFHNTIHIFKNYFAIVFSVFSFQFQQNKFYTRIF